MRRTLPNRNRWEGWVVLAWLLAVIAVIAGLGMIGAMGSMEVPERDAFGNVTWRETINPVVWGAAIGQALASLLLAAIFSILNSTYQNSCDMFEYLHASQRPEHDSQPADGQEDAGVDDSLPGLMVEKVNAVSPLEGILHPGFKLLSINGHRPVSEIDAAKQVRKGDNELVFVNRSGETIKRTVPMRPGPLHIKFRE